jgi:plastocyanin
MTRFLILGASILTAMTVLAACANHNDDSGGGGASRAQPVATDVVSIEDFTFEPQVIEIDAGTDVSWENEDDFAHTVTARDDSFKSANIGGGDEFTQSFDDPGEYAYFCSIHNSMTGTVIVK